MLGPNILSSPSNNVISKLFYSDDEQFRFNDVSTHEGHLLQNGTLSYFCNEMAIMMTLCYNEQCHKEVTVYHTLCYILS